MYKRNHMTAKVTAHEVTSHNLQHYAQEALNKTTYDEGTDIQEHIKLLRTRKAAVDNLDASVMSDEAWRGVIIRSIPPTARWLSIIPSLCAMASSADIISTLLAYVMIIGRNTKTSASSLNTVLVARTIGKGCSNPNCKAKKRSTHTTADCYWPGGGKEGQFPANFGQRNRANTIISGPTTSRPEHFVLSAIIPNSPGQSRILIDDSPRVLISQRFQNFQKGKVPTFMDSGASDTMFVSRNAFSDYKPVTPRKGDSAKAENGSFEIVGEGHVVQRYQVDGRERDITYTRALCYGQYPKPVLTF